MSKKGEIINRVNEERYTKESLGKYKVKIIIYNGSTDIIVEFQDEHKARAHTTYQHFKEGNIKTLIILLYMGLDTLEKESIKV